MIRTIIIDDEPLARKNLALILNKFCKPDIEIIGEAGSVQEAELMIRRLLPQLIFLDIEMGAETGFDLLAKFEKPEFSIVFVTAFDQYAIKAIKFCALDYLLKPVNIGEVQQAIERVKKLPAAERKESIISLADVLKNPGSISNRLAIPTLQGYTMLPVESIIYLTAQKDYTLIHCAGKAPLCSSSNIGYYEEMLAGYGFFRLHHSHIINRKHMQAYYKSDGGQVQMNDGTFIPVSRRKKQEFLDWLNGINI